MENDQLKKSLTSLHLLLKGNDIELTETDKFVLDNYILDTIHTIDLTKQKESGLEDKKTT